MKRQPRYKKGDTIGGRFLVHEALMGGMGEVYLGIDDQHGAVALKTFQAGLDARARKVFEREVGSWVALGKHPNIVRCYLMDEYDNQPFMVLEWVLHEEGYDTDLRSWLRKEGKLELRQTLDIMIDLCRGLIHANQVSPGIVHRDLKPANILIARGGIAKITDFGLAKVVQESELEITTQPSGPGMNMSLTGGVVGTLPYMPPEQWLVGSKLDERSEIYALGVVGYEMLTGKWPFLPPFGQRRLPSAWQKAHSSQPLPSLPTSVPEAVSQLLAQCLVKKGSERPSLTHLLSQLTTLYQALFATSPKALPAIGEMTAIEYNNRGFTYDNLGHYSKALVDYGLAMQINPQYADAYVNRGVTYHNLERYSEALADYRRAIQINPSLASAYLNRGVTYQNLGRYSKALADYGRAIQINPSLASAYLNRGNTYHKMRHIDKALADYGRAMQINPHFAQAYFNRANTYQNLGDYSKALADYGDAIQINPHLAQVYYNRGLIYQNLGRYDDALTDYRRAMQINPQDVNAYFNTGTLYYNRKQKDDALPYFEKIAQLGDQQAVQIVENIRRELGMAPQANPTQQAFDAFVAAGSPNEMIQAVRRFPFMVQDEFMALVVDVIQKQVPASQRPYFEQRLVALRAVGQTMKLG